MASLEELDERLMNAKKAVVHAYKGLVAMHRRYLMFFCVLGVLGSILNLIDSGTDRLGIFCGIFYLAVITLIYSAYLWDKRTYKILKEDYTRQYITE